MKGNEKIEKRKLQRKCAKEKSDILYKGASAHAQVCLNEKRYTKICQVAETGKNARYSKNGKNQKSKNQTSKQLPDIQMK